MKIDGDPLNTQHAQHRPVRRRRRRRLSLFVNVIEEGLSLLVNQSQMSIRHTLNGGGVTGSSCHAQRRGRGCFNSECFTEAYRGIG